MHIIHKKNVLERNISRLESLELKLLELQGRAEEYIEQIEKSEIRMMFRLYYIDDMTWYQVAMKMNKAFPKRRTAYTEDNCKQRHKRFLDKVD